VTLAQLNRWRHMVVTFAYGRYSRLSLAQVGRDWGESEWTGRDLWERP
jgi:hypothetical protein